MADNGFSAGSIFVAFRASVDDFQKGLKSAIDGLKSFGNQVGAIASKVATVGRSIASAMTAPIRAIGTLASSLFTLKGIIAALVVSQGFKALVTGPAKAAVELERMAARAGIATDQLERLQFVVNAAGGHGDDVSLGIEKLNKILDDTRRGATDFLPVLKELGIEGLSTAQVLDKLLNNPKAAAGGLKRLGISEFAVLAKLSREEIEKLQQSFVNLGNGTDAGLFKLGNRLQVVTTQLKTAFGNVADQISSLILPPLVKGLEFAEQFIERHFPEILGFFDTVGQQVGQLFDAIKRTAQTPAKLAEALRVTVEEVFKTIGDIVTAGFEGFVKIGIASAKAIAAGVVLLLGPFFRDLWEATKIQLDNLLEKAGVTIQKWFQGLLLDFFTTLGSVPGFGEIAAKQIVEIGQKLKELNQQQEVADQERNDKLLALADQLQQKDDAFSKGRIDKFKETAGAAATEGVTAIQKIAKSLLDSAGKVLSAFGFSLEGFSIEFDKNIKKRIDERNAVLSGPSQQQPNQQGQFGVDFLPEEQVKADVERRRQENERQLAESTAAIGDLVGGLANGLHSFFNDVFVEGKKTIEALGDFASKISDKFIGSTIDNLTKGLSEGLAAAFKNPALGGAIADLAGALIGIGATIVSIVSKRKSSSKSFASVEDGVHSTQALRGIVAGPASVSIAAVGEDLTRALVPTNQILTDGFSAVVRAITGKGGGSSGFSGFGFAGAVPTT